MHAGKVMRQFPFAYRPVLRYTTEEKEGVGSSPGGALKEERYPATEMTVMRDGPMLEDLAFVKYR